MLFHFTRMLVVLVAIADIFSGGFPGTARNHKNNIVGHKIINAIFDIKVITLINKGITGKNQKQNKTPR